LGITPNLTNSTPTTLFHIHSNIVIPKDFNKIEYLALFIAPQSQGKPFNITTEIRQIDPILHSPLALASATDLFTPDYIVLGATGQYYQHRCPNAATIIQNNAATIVANGGFLSVRVQYPGSAGGALNTKHFALILSYE
jgi:hypothetical protein